MPSATFRWTCPSCDHIHEADHVDAIDGPFITAICLECNGVFDHTQLTDAENAAWEQAIETARAGLSIYSCGHYEPFNGSKFYDHSCAKCHMQRPAH